MATATTDEMDVSTMEAPDTTDAPSTNGEQKDDRQALADLDPNTRVSIMVTMPAGLKLKILDRAEEKDQTVARFVRESLAEDFDYDLPDFVRTRAPKYKTEEERKGAQKARSSKRNALIKKLLEAYKTGDIDLSEDDSDDDE